MNQASVLQAAWYACRALGQPTSVRNLIAMFRRITDKGIRTQDALRWLNEFEHRETVGKQTGNTKAQLPETSFPHKSTISETVGKQDPSEPGNLHAHAVKVLNIERQEVTSVTSRDLSPEKIAEPLALLPPVPKPAKPKNPRIISAYAGTTVESFGDEAPLVREILACDGFGIGTKAFSRALETLAMWRTVYGEAAFLHGLRVTADKRIGHRYVGGVAKRYDPEQDRPPERFADRYEPNESDRLPTLAELLAAGKVERWSDQAASA